MDVHAGPEHDVVALQKKPGPFHLLIERAQRRATITGDIGRRVQAGGRIALALHHRQADQGLGSVHEHAPGFERVFVIKADRVQTAGSLGHAILSRWNMLDSVPQMEI